MASPTVTVLDVNLAQVCVESSLYGIFFLLVTTSLSLLVTRRWKNHNGTSTLSVGGTLLKTSVGTAERRDRIRVLVVEDNQILRDLLCV